MKYWLIKFDSLRISSGVNEYGTIEYCNVRDLLKEKNIIDKAKIPTFLVIEEIKDNIYKEILSDMQISLLDVSKYQTGFVIPCYSILPNSINEVGIGVNFHKYSDEELNLLTNFLIETAELKSAEFNNILNEKKVIGKKILNRKREK